MLWNILDRLGLWSQSPRQSSQDSGPGQPSGRRCHHDDRAVSPVVGAILVFALMLGLLVILQVTAIPALNNQEEFEHNLRAQVDVVAVGNAVDRTATTGSGETVSIEAGMHYPPRMLFVNPPPVTGTVRTTTPKPLVIDNAQATGETGDYWDGTARDFPTRSLVYAADYNEYRAAPRTVYESWVVFNRFADAQRPLTDGSFVDGRRITLTTLDGRVSRSTDGSQSLSVEPVSAPTQAVLVRGADGPVTLTLPTELTEDQWETLLEDEFDPTGDPTNDRYVSGITCERSPPAPCERLTLTLERDVAYELRLGKVQLGGTASDPEGTYLVNIEGDETSVPENGTQKVVAEARDRFDNPVSGITVDARVAGPGRIRAVTPETGVDGRATFVYEAPADIQRTTEVTVTASFGTGTSQTTATFTIRVMDLDGSGSGPP